MWSYSCRVTALDRASIRLLNPLWNAVLEKDLFRAGKVVQTDIIRHQNKSSSQPQNGDKIILLLILYTMLQANDLHRKLQVLKAI